MSPIEISILLLFMLCCGCGVYVGFSFADMIEGDHLGQPKHPHRLFAAMLVMVLSWLFAAMLSLLELIGTLEKVI